MSDEPKIKHVYSFANGMCMVFDQYGQQMPDYQGRTEEMTAKIREAGYTGEIEQRVWR